MKILKLEKGEPAYISIPENCTITFEYTKIVRNGQKLVLVKVI